LLLSSETIFTGRLISHAALPLAVIDLLMVLIDRSFFCAFRFLQDCFFVYLIFGVNEVVRIHRVRALGICCVFHFHGFSGRVVLFVASLIVRD
jgi:hypothetical protein